MLSTPSSSVPSQPSTKSSLPTTIHTLQNLQSSRVKAHKHLSQTFDSYLSHQTDANTYKTTCAEITQTFKSISEQVLAIRDELMRSNESDPLKSFVVNWIPRIQSLEKQALELSVKQQIYKSETQFGQRDYSNELLELNPLLEETRQKINDLLVELNAELADFVLDE